MNGSQKPLIKNPIQKPKNSKHQGETAACEQKITSEKAKFCSNNVFSLYLTSLQIKFKNFHAEKTPGFFSVLPVSAWPKLLLQFDFKKSNSGLQKFKFKFLRHKTIKIIWIVKNQE